MELFHYRAEVLKVVDGDTLDLLVDVGFHWSGTIRVRLLALGKGINAPERFSPGGPEATAHLRELLGLEPVIIRTYKDPGDKYGRWLATVWASSIDVGTQMVLDGHAVEKSYG